MAMSKAQVARKNKQVPELMGRHEVAELLDTAPNNISVVVGLPAAIDNHGNKLKRGDLWRADVMRDFAAERAAKKEEARRRRDG